VPDLPLIRPLRLAFDLDRRIEEVFTELIHEPWGRAFGAGVWQPAVYVYETDDAYLIEADIPGVAPENVEVHVEGRRLIIRGTRDTVTWSHSQAGRNVQIERQHGHFCRSLELDHPVEIKRLQTQFEQGTLRARLPKKRETTAVSND
jgi:HSP20 family protein